MNNVILGVSGSISAYKASDIANELTKRKIQVHVLMTKNSTAFITPLTLQTLSKNPVHLDVLTEEKPDQINHIDLAKKADLFLIAPASANIIGKLANGIADDMISTVALALPDIPKFIAPAMNTRMYDNPVVQRNLHLLKDFGYQEIEPRTSLLACGDFGKGALATVENILEVVLKALN